MPGKSSGDSRKVWQKDGIGLHPEIESYEVGKDYLYDGLLFKYELAASQAQAIMLNRIGILNKQEFNDVENEIKNLYKKYGNFIELTIEDEDIHSKLENILTGQIGETGKKIHTGRSRNDQVMVVMRLFEKESLFSVSLELTELMESLIGLAEKEGDKVLPGYTHTKQAMLINVKFWASAFIESSFDNLKVIKNVLNLIDSNPLGSGSGFGVPIPLDRELTASLLGFSRVQKNPMAVQNSRGKYEGMIIDALWNIMNDFSRMASDLLLYNMDELLYVKTNSIITTGSSIMPQKRNLDVMELLRARASVMLSYSNNVKSIINGLISGYNRDIQETKEPVFKAFELVLSSIKTVKVVLKNIEFDEAAIRKCLSGGIFATDIAFEAVGRGVPFRDAYKLAAENIDKIELNEETIKDSIKKRVSPGSPVTIDLEEYKTALREENTFFNKTLKTFQSKLYKLIT